MLNNKTRYVQHRIAGWMALKAGRVRAKALGVVTRGRSVECELGAWGLKRTGYRVTENRDGCVLVFAWRDDHQSVQYTCD